MIYDKLTNGNIHKKRKSKLDISFFNFTRQETSHIRTAREFEKLQMINIFTFSKLVLLLPLLPQYTFSTLAFNFTFLLQNFASTIEYFVLLFLIEFLC